MARKIEATPTLTGEDARRFIERMNEPATKEEIESIERAKKIFKTIKFTR